MVWNEKKKERLYAGSIKSAYIHAAAECAS